MTLNTGRMSLAAPMLETMETELPPDGPQSAVAGTGAAKYEIGLNGAQRRSAVPPGGTASRDDRGRRQVPCKAGCGRLVTPTGRKGATGKCRGCWRAGLGTDGRKTDPAEQFALLERLFLSAVRRAVAEDPGLSLPMLLHLQEQLGERVDDAGVEQVRRVGAQQVADDLSLSTRETWGRKRSWKRWGPSSPAALRRYPEDSSEGMRPGPSVDKTAEVVAGVLVAAFGNTLAGAEQAERFAATTAELREE